MKKRGNPKSDWKPDNRVAYDPSPVQLKVMPGVRERLRSISNWQDKVRLLLDQLIESETGD